MTIIPSNEDEFNILVKRYDLIVGSFLFLLSGFLSIVFIPNSDFKSLLYVNQELIKSNAIILDIRETNCSYDENKILEYKYRFLEFDKTQIGLSYSYNSKHKINDIVQIEFVQGNMNLSRIIGMINAPYEPYVGGLISLFPLIGLGLIIAGLKEFNRHIMILKDFSFTTGNLVSKEDVNIEINDPPSYKLKYEYEHLGKKYIITCYSASPNEFNEIEKLIYSNNCPNHSVLLKKLPSELQTKISKIINTESNS